MGILKSPIAYLLTVLLSRQVSCKEIYKKCAFETPYDFVLNNEPEGSPLALAADILITGLTEVADSGGSFSVDVEYVKIVLYE